MHEIVTLSATHEVGSFGWHHALAWRQLSAVWLINVSHHLAERFSGTDREIAACSVAVADGEYHADLLQRCLTPLPTIVFLDRASLRFGGPAAGVAVEPQGHYRSENGRHVFRIEPSHPLVEGLPRTVSIYGQCPVVTPLRVEEGGRVLVSLDGVPIISYHQHCLTVGANPWQLGVPSVPMLYKVLSNWLIHETGYRHRVLDPYAVIRFDDLPVTAEQLKSVPATPALDVKRSRTVRRLRKFADRSGAKFTLMYSSHFRGEDGSLISIGSVMPKSIREMEAGVRQGVFEVGSHGMTHLREFSTATAILDPREFLGLDEQETAMHLDGCEEEIFRLFGTAPNSFVAPAWGYHTGVTKRVAAQRYSVIVDSSQHVETGACDVSLTPGEGGDYLHVVETFRSGSRMLDYSNPDFWRCYAAAGIPIHFMQHTDKNWHILRDVIKPRTIFLNGSWVSRLVDYAGDPKRPLYLRALSTALLAILRCGHAPSRQLLRRALTHSSIYAFVRAMKRAGYKCITLAEFRTEIMNHKNGEFRKLSPPSADQQRTQCEVGRS